MKMMTDNLKKQAQEFAIELEGGNVQYFAYTFDDPIFTLADANNVTSRASISSTDC